MIPALYILFEDHDQRWHEPHDLDRGERELRTSFHASLKQKYGSAEDYRFRCASATFFIPFHRESDFVNYYYCKGMARVWGPRGPSAKGVPGNDRKRKRAQGAEEALGADAERGKGGAAGDGVDAAGAISVEFVSDDEVTQDGDGTANLRAGVRGER